MSMAFDGTGLLSPCRFIHIVRHLITLSMDGFTATVQLLAVASEQMIEATQLNSQLYAPWYEK
jgi:hypothetical protein